MIIENVIKYIFHNYNWHLENYSAKEPEECIDCKALYIHVPFCSSLCPFCIFHSVLYNKNLVKDYFDSMKKEIDKYIDKNYNFESIYIGGGTPTLTTSEVCDLIDYVKNYYKIKEISIEGSIQDISDEKVNTLKECGTTRLSLGVEAIQPSIQKSIGRANIDEEEILSKIDMASKIKTLNVDILFNLPNQTINDLGYEIEKIKDSKANQLTFYPIMPSIRNNNLNKEIDESKEKQFYFYIMKNFVNSYFYQSNAWTYSKGSDFITDEYIVDYPYFAGIGTGAMSYINGKYLVNSFNINKYEKLISKNSMPTILSKDLSLKEQVYLEFIYKFYSFNIDNDTFEKLFGANIENYMKEELYLLYLINAIKKDSNKIVITDYGKYIANLLMKYFYINVSKIRKYCIENNL
ncbi:Fe-S oxidoreductase, coproporphyrinogen III oxidase [Caldisphaera lagunensis DSM 15908]|uniref:Fe-S oxidoreductase, coproporphyrinogen III oxidase n=1 Tax=Caldisphaera lagunensis (strain DSM 15908 / JCM 11604 / ANMR 0165 / IC-154) TaxID=1056495 RepID=L0A9E4_CALLD|nr:radical SAM protein [Caldisphaera lagunensis]AFZ70518.1 Fe-S oxidoreductase, coproporphyrinogen III oxidase [Caldisphaera lagunensis DSM 15908]